MILHVLFHCDVIIAVQFIWIKVHHLILLFVCIAVDFLFLKKLVMLSLKYSSLVRIQSLWFCLVLVVYNKTNVSCHFLLISKLFNKGNIPLRFASLNITYLGWIIPDIKHNGIKYLLSIRSIGVLGTLSNIWNGAFSKNS